MSDASEQPRPRFRIKRQVASITTDPEALFGELPSTPKGVGALWSHQADQLRHYYNTHRDTADVALELPTGSGKTLVGLLIGEWRRRSLGQRVVYACPTKQLARQVAAKAQDQGIPAVLLVGSHKGWEPQALNSYTRGQALAVTVYSAIFNYNSHLADAETLIFDDAHAAEGFVAEAWALQVSRELDQYSQLLDAVGEDIDKGFVERMLAPDGPAADGGEIRLLPVAAVARRVDDISAVLAQLTDDPSWRFKMIRNNLASCLFYVARSGFYVRPMIPPTFLHTPFLQPSQRVYLSATLGQAGELERAFGRHPIERVPVPKDWARTGSGRRFFVFPALATDEDGNQEIRDGEEDAELQLNPSLTTRLLNLAPKRLVLTPDDKRAKQIADEVGVSTAERFDAKDPDVGLEPFLEAERGTLLAPNRYDGMDLADEACRLMIMSGLPASSHLQDRFLEGRLRAGVVLQERIRTRVVQGAGRCTRGPKDWAVVIVEGQDLRSLLSRREVVEALPVELQAEVSFGMDISTENSADDLVMLAQSALAQDDVWLQDAEPELAQRRRGAEQKKLPNVDALAASAQLEVKAWRLAWQQDWDNASKAAVGVLDHLAAEDLRPYRAFWSYLASAWATMVGGGPGSASVERASAMREGAHREAAGTTWLKEVEGGSSSTAELDAIDEEAIGRVIALARGRLQSQAKYLKETSEMVAGLAQRKSGKYEAALVALGRLAGADSSKPSGQGRADAVWIWKGRWVTVEAKSESNHDGLLSMDYVRQTNTQLDSVAADLAVDEVPEGSVSIIVTPRDAVDPDAVAIAGAHVFHARPKLLSDLGHDVARAWNELRPAMQGLADTARRDEATAILWKHRVLPTQLIDRLTQDPIRGR